MRHKPVLLKEVIENLQLKEGATFLDLTLGSAGHSQEVCKLGIKDLTLIGVDKDSDAVNRSAKYLESCKGKVILETSPNSELDIVLRKHGIEKVDSILIDLGVSSEQIDISGRGFTFQKDEPLQMTMKKNPSDKDLTAKIVVNTFSEESLADIIYGFGEERYARRIAKGIVEARKTKEIQTTFELVEIIKRACPAKLQRSGRKIHPATRTFQAIRMAVNDEFESLTITLNKAFESLKTDGRLLVISFHSIEDRIVKRWMREKEDKGHAKRINKKTISPSESELKENPRARSSKLRILQKII
jgi:16S rRNA (cytosine1402-N4)-methyltransferase